MNKLLLFFRFGLAKRLFRECRVYGDNPEGNHHDLYTHLLVWHMRCVFNPKHLSGKARDDERSAEIERFQKGLAHPKSLHHFISLIDELLASADKCIEMGMVYSNKNPLTQTGVNEFSPLQRAIHNMQLTRTLALMHPFIFSRTLLREKPLPQRES